MSRKFKFKTANNIKVFCEEAINVDFTEYIECLQGALFSLTPYQDHKGYDNLPLGLYIKDNKLQGEMKLEIFDQHQFRFLFLVQGLENEVESANFVLNLEVNDKLTISRPGESNLEDYWLRIQEELELPDMAEILTKEIRKSDIYYLLAKFATITIWNSDDYTPPNEEGKLLEIAGCSAKFKVYDFATAIVATVCQLWGDHGLEDVIKTSRALAKEIKKRGWNIDLSGYDKMKQIIFFEIARMNRLDPQNRIKLYNYQMKKDEQQRLEQLYFDASYN